MLASSIAVRGALDNEALCWDVAEVVSLRGRTAPTQLARPLTLATPNRSRTTPGPQPVQLVRLAVFLAGAFRAAFFTVFFAAA